MSYKELGNAIKLEDKELIAKTVKTIVEDNDREYNIETILAMALENAMKFSKYNSLQYLIDNGASPVHGYEYTAPIFTAIENDDVKSFKIFLDNYEKIGFEFKRRQSDIVKHIIRKGSATILKLAIDKDFDVHYGFKKHLENDIWHILQNEEIDKIVLLVNCSEQLNINFKKLLSVEINTCDISEKMFNSISDIIDYNYIRTQTVNDYIKDGKFWILPKLIENNFQLAFYDIDSSLKEELFIKKQFDTLDLLREIAPVTILINFLLDEEVLDDDHIRYYHNNEWNRKKNDYQHLYFVTMFNDTEVINETLSLCKFLKSKKNFIASSLINCIKRGDFESLEKIKAKLKLDDDIMQHADDIDTIELIKYFEKNSINISVDIYSFTKDGKSIEDIKYIINSEHKYDTDYLFEYLIKKDNLDLLKLLLTKTSIDKDNTDYVETAYDSDSTNVLKYLIANDYSVSADVDEEMNYVR